MKISDYLNKNFCFVEISATDKKNAIIEIASALGEKNVLLDKDKFIADVLERESLGSTGIGYNVAIPHARTDSVRGFVIALGRSAEGVEFNSLDGENAKLVFLLGANPSELNLYLRLLAELSKLLMSAPFRAELLEAAGKDEIIAIVRKFEAR